MCLRINIEDLAANALIELLEREGKREVLFENLNRYGRCVVQFLKEQNKDEDVVLIYSREAKQLLFFDYTDYFEPILCNGVLSGIKLRDYVDSSMLWNRFRSRIKVRLLRAFMNDKAFVALVEKAA